MDLSVEREARFRADDHCRWSLLERVPPLMLVSLVCVPLFLFSSMGLKYLAAYVLGMSALCLLALIRPIEHGAIVAIVAGISIAFRYGVFEHGSQFELVEHVGGAEARAVLHLVDIPLFLIAAIALLRLFRGRRTLPRWTGFDTAVVLLIASMLPSLRLGGESAAYTLFELFRYGKYMVLYWSLRVLVTRPSHLHAAFVAVGGAILLQTMVGGAQYFLGFRLPVPVGRVSGVGYELVNGKLLMRITGLIGNANVLATYLLIPLSFATAYFFGRISSYRRAVAAVIIMAGCGTMLLTFSRNGLFSTVIIAAAAIPILIRGRRLSPRLMVFATGAVAVVTVGAMMLGVLSDVIARVTFRAQGMVNPRLDLMKVSLSMVRNHPFRGVGLNRFENVMAHYDASGITNVIAHPVHNIYLLIGAETGLVSLVLFLMAGGILTFFSFSVLRRGEDEMVRITGIAGMLSCVGIAVSGLFDYALRQEPVLGMLVLVAALVVTQYTKLNEPEERPAVTRAGSAQDA